MNRLPFGRGVLVLLLASAVLGGVITIQLGAAAYQPPSPPGPPEPGGATVADEALSAYQPPSRALFEEVQVRPLFYSGRTAPQDDTGTQSVAVAAPELVAKMLLEGILLTEGKHIALLRVTTGGELERVNEGDTFRGWQVDAVEPLKVVFKKGERVEELKLEVAESNPRSAAVRGLPSAVRKGLRGKRRSALSKKSPAVTQKRQ